MATKKTGDQETEVSSQKPEAQPGAETGTPPKDEVKPDAAARKEETIPEQIERCAAELKSCDLRPTAEEMFGRFMVSVAGRPLSVHQPANEIADTAERLTAEWLSRKGKFAAK